MGVQTTIRNVGLNAWPKVVLLGDSITQFSFSHEGCWGARLAARLQRKCDVVNRGFSGYNSRWFRIALPRILSAAAAEDVMGVTLCLGTNDSNTPDNPRRHVPIDEYQDNLFDMVDYLKSVGIPEKSVVLMTPPACDEIGHTRDCEQHGRQMTKSLDLAGRYAAACQSIAHECGTKFVNVYAEMLQHKDWRSMLNDGVHLSPTGGALFDSLVGPHMEELTKDLPVILPTYRQMDINNPELSLIGTLGKRSAESSN